jgi:hypothetical protein
MHTPWDRRHADTPHRPEPADRRDDFGQADYSQDFGYDPQQRAGYRLDRDDGARNDDYGQADYGRDYAYDPDSRTGYRREAGPADEPRTWRGRPAHPDHGTRREREREAADRRIFAIVSERLEHDRRVDSSDVELRVENRVVFLDGTVRTREGKRRIEHMAELDGVADIVNALRVREAESRRGWFG